MNYVKRTLIGGILLLAVLTGLFGVFLQLKNNQSNTRQRMEAKVSEIKAIDKALGNEDGLDMTVSRSVRQKIMSKTMLTATACKKILTDSDEPKPMMFMDGAIVRVTDKGIETPKGFPAEKTPTAEEITGEAYYTYTYNADSDPYGLPDYLVFYSRIDGDYYYIEPKTYDELVAKEGELFDVDKGFKGIEDAFHTKILIIFPSFGESEHLLYYRPDAFEPYETAESLGITDEMISGAFSAKEELSAEALAEACRYIYVDGQQYELILRELEYELMEGTVIAYLTPSREAELMVREKTRIILGVFMIIGIIFLVWLISVIWLVCHHALNENQREEYSIKRNRLRVMGILGISAAVILASSALFLSLFRLFDINRQVDTALKAMQKQIGDNEEQSRNTAKVNKELYEEYASMTARIMTEYPGIFDAEDLQTVCDKIDALYIMLFDENGDEILSNTDYVGLSLGRDASSSTHEFRLLLNGVPMITHEAMIDEQTRLKNVMIGARVGSPKAGERYGAMLMAVPEGKINSGGAESVESVMRSLVSEGMLAFSVNTDSGLIRDASDRTLVGMNASAIGLPENALEPGFQDFFTLNGVTYYGKNAGIDGTLYFFAARSNHIYSGIPVDSLLAALVSVVLLSVLALYLLRAYRKTFEGFASEGVPLDVPVNDLKLSDGTQRRSTDPSRRWRSLYPKNDARMPRRNVVITAQILFLISIVLIYVNLYAARSGERVPLIDFIVRGQWTKGFNLFAIANVVLLLVETVVIVTTVKLLIRLVSSALGTRGETVCRLLLSLVGYAGGIFFVYYALYNLGYSPGTLLASLGLLSFAVSLGAKDLVTDIVAGLSIVFEGTYQIGDIIEVSNYRGEVLEIGVRTTKLEGRGGNIKMIANRDVKNVVNMTRKNSWYPLDITVSAEHSLETIEEMLEEQLPHIGASIPEIVSGPYYKGVVGLSKGDMTLSIIAECNEADYYKVQRALNRAIQELFAEKEIRIL